MSGCDVRCALCDAPATLHNEQLPDRHTPGCRNEPSSARGEARARRIADGYAILVETVEAMRLGSVPPDAPDDYDMAVMLTVGQHRALVRALGMVRS